MLHAYEVREIVNGVLKSSDGKKNFVDALLEIAAELRKYNAHQKEIDDRLFIKKEFE